MAVGLPEKSPNTSAPRLAVTSAFFSRPHRERRRLQRPDGSSRRPKSRWKIRTQ